MLFDTVEARRHFERAFEGFKNKKYTAGALMAWAGAVDTIYLERGDFSRRDKWSQSLQDILGDSMTFPSLDIEVSVVTGMIEIILSRMHDHQGAGAWIKKAMELIESDIPAEKTCYRRPPSSVFCLYRQLH